MKKLWIIVAVASAAMLVACTSDDAKKAKDVAKGAAEKVADGAKELSNKVSGHVDTEKVKEVASDAADGAVEGAKNLSESVSEGFNDVKTGAAILSGQETMGGEDYSSPSEKIEHATEKMYRAYVDAYNRQDGSEKKCQAELYAYENTLTKEEKQVFLKTISRLDTEETGAVNQRAIQVAKEIIKAESEGDTRKLEKLCKDSYSFAHRLTPYRYQAYRASFMKARAMNGISNVDHIEGVSQQPF